MTAADREEWQSESIRRRPFLVFNPTKKFMELDVSKAQEAANSITFTERNIAIVGAVACTVAAVAAAVLVPTL
jgi:hypothetical protein